MMTGPILLQGAMAVETEWLISRMDAPEEQEIGGYHFWSGKCRGHALVVCRTGIGELNAACATTLGLLHFRPEAVINQGIAGSHSEKIHIGDIVLGESCIYIHDIKTPIRDRGEGSAPFSWTLGENTPLMEGDDALLARFLSAPYSGGDMVRGRLGSGDIFSREYDRILWLRERCGHLCEDMESAAVYKACHSLGVPCLGVRIISNNELTGEPYTPSVGETLQKLVLEICTGAGGFGTRPYE